MSDLDDLTDDFPRPFRPLLEVLDNGTDCGRIDFLERIFQSGKADLVGLEQHNDDSAAPVWNKAREPQFVVLFNFATNLLSSAQRLILARSCLSLYVDRIALDTPSDWHDEPLAFLLLIAENDMGDAIRRGLIDRIREVLSQRSVMKSISQTRCLQLLVGYKAFCSQNFWEGFLAIDDARRVAVVIEGLAVHHFERTIQLLKQFNYPKTIVDALIWILPLLVDNFPREYVGRVIWKQLDDAPASVVKQFDNAWRQLGFPRRRKPTPQQKSAPSAANESSITAARSTGLQYEDAWLSTAEGVLQALSEIRVLLSSHPSAAMRSIMEIVAKSRTYYSVQERRNKVREVTEKAYGYDKFRFPLDDNVFRLMVTSEPLFWLSSSALLVQKSPADVYVTIITISKCLLEKERLANDLVLNEHSSGVRREETEYFGELLNLLEKYSKDLVKDEEKERSSA